MQTATLNAISQDGTTVTIQQKVHLHTSAEVAYNDSGGNLTYVLDQILALDGSSKLR